MAKKDKSFEFTSSLLPVDLNIIRLCSMNELEDDTRWTDVIRNNLGILGYDE
jgi:hypothetical protein